MYYPKFLLIMFKRSLKYSVFGLLISGMVLFMASCNLQPGESVEIPVFSENYERFVRTLSSDEFEGRAPTTPGGKKTKAYIEAEFRRMGLKPAVGNSFRQPVPLIEILGSNFSDLTISSMDGNIELSFSYKDEMIVGTTRLQENVNLEESELIFAGYGIVAPEFGWNDYEGLDVTGKTVVVLVNDPGYELEDPELFTGNAMTYYGRWTYKYEEAARQGAAGVLIVHETGPAGYGWDVVRNSWSGPQYQVGGNNGPSVLVQGWLHNNSAALLFDRTAYNLTQLKEMALSPDFQPFSLGMNVSVSFDTKYTQSDSYNIAGYVEGSERPEETIIYMAHWDHLGKVETPEGVRIYNGAIDNATGTAAIMAIAEKFAAMDPAPKRSVVFIAVTAEESGLIGSQYYAQNPLFPLEKTVGGINIDGLNVYGPTHDIVVVGYNMTQMQDYLSRHAADQERVLVPERYPERGYFYRSDHFNLVKEGVPMIYANSGNDFMGRNEQYAAKVQEDQENRYHSPDDVINELWDWRGLHQNLWLFYNVGKELADSNDWPRWREGTEFEAIRQATDHLRE
jgi:Zn-dependent M28 family amino/carboxypeptidase